MIATLYSTGQLNAPLGFAAALAMGFAFGLCLEKAGFGSSRRLSGVFYFTDMTVIKVMFTAMITAAIGLVAVQRMGLAAADSMYLLPAMLGAHAIGGIIFGVAFAMGGWCPGTAAVGLASGRLDALVFLVGLLGGSIAFNEAYPWVESWTALGSRGVVFLHQSLGITQDQLLLGLTGLAVLLFWLCEVVERGPALARPGVGKLSLAGFCALLCVGALVALNMPQISLRAPGPPVAAVPRPAALEPAQTGAAQQEGALLAAVEKGHDHMEPWELAERLMAGDSTLLLVDIRSKEEFDAFHLRGAQNIALPHLPEALAAKRGSGIIILYSNGMTHPAQARDALARLGFANIYLLTGGLDGFFEEVLKPASLRTVSVDQEKTALIASARAFFLPQAAGRGQASGMLDAPAQLPALVQPEWLAANLGKPGLKIIDLRAQPQYNSGHIPGSLALNLESLRGNMGGLPAMLLPGEDLARRLGQMGTTPRELVVIVAGESPHDATLLAMALERVGHSRYAILQGGMKAWNALTLPMDTALPKVAPTSYPVPAGPDGFTVSGAQTHAAMVAGKTSIVDVRPSEYFEGAKSDEARAGHIPGAISRPYTEDHLKSQDGVIRLKPVGDLEKAYAAIFSAKDQPVIVHCRTGHQASQTWWVLTRLLGYTNVKYYDASWTEWSATPEWPVARQEKKPEGKPEAKEKAK